jgi:hypothetical protein
MIPVCHPVDREYKRGITKVMCCGEKLCSLQYHLGCMLVNMVSGTGIRISVKKEDVHNGASLAGKAGPYREKPGDVKRVSGVDRVGFVW